MPPRYLFSSVLCLFLCLLAGNIHGANLPPGFDVRAAARGFIPDDSNYQTKYVQERPDDKARIYSESSTRVYGKTYYTSIEQVIKDMELLDRLEKAKKKSEKRDCSRTPPTDPSYLRNYNDLGNQLAAITAEGIDLEMQKSARAGKGDWRFKGNCLRAIKYAMCIARPSAKDIKNGGSKDCPYGDYAKAGSAKDYPQELANNKSGPWVNVSCHGADGKRMTPEEAPINSIICYKAIDQNALVNGKRDSAAVHGHCEIKVSNCKFCYDGCAVNPRTGALKSAEGKNREVFAVMVRKYDNSPKPCKIDNKPRVSLKQQPTGTVQGGTDGN